MKTIRMSDTHSISHVISESINQMFPGISAIFPVMGLFCSLLAWSKQLLTVIMVTENSVRIAQMISAYTGSTCALITLFFVVIRPFIIKPIMEKRKQKKKNPK